MIVMSKMLQDCAQFAGLGAFCSGTHVQCEKSWSIVLGETTPVP
jgi:hypothetical protein